MQGIILINSYYDAPEAMYQPRRLAEAFRALGVPVRILRGDELPLRLVGGALAGKPQADFCIFLDKDKYRMRALEQAGMRLFNRREVIEACDDKMLTFLALAGRGVPMPDTVPGLLCYTPAAPVRDETLDFVERTLGYPVVVKECFGSLGKGVHLAEDRASLAALAERVKCMPHLFQRFEGRRGEDVRAIVIGGKFVGAMLRRGAGDFRSNIGAGGSAQPYAADAALVSLSERVAHLLGADFCGVDLLFGKEGWTVCEVNSNAFFGAFERVTGIDVAAEYARHVLAALRGQSAF